MKIRNLKVTITLKKKLLNYQFEKTHNIFKIKCENKFVTLTFYKNNPLTLHVTGLKNFHHLKIFLSQIKEFYLSHKVDTVFFLEKTVHKHNLYYLAKDLKKKFHELYCIDYNAELFSGIFLKPKIKTYPTIIMHSKSYIMLSRRTLFFVIEMKKKIDALLATEKN